MTERPSTHSFMLEYFVSVKTSWSFHAPYTPVRPLCALHCGGHDTILPLRFWVAIFPAVV